jgi:phosphomevalonate kinase
MVSIEDSANEYHRVSVPGLADGWWRFRVGPGDEIVWQDGNAGGRLDLFECIWRHCAGNSMPAISVRIDTRAFFDSKTGSKIGLGSSAAVTAALVRAISIAAGSGGDTWPLARQIHQEFQQGRGSGVDIAASVFGGLLAYRMDDDAEPHKMSWPSGLHYRFLWSGKSADTVEKLQRLAERRNRDSAELADAADTLVPAWSSGDARETLAALNRYVIALARFSVNHDLGIFDAGHGALQGLAQSRDVVYKPCGAGGGDIGVAIAESVDVVEDFCGKAKAHGFATLDLECDSEGVTELNEDRT